MKKTTKSHCFYFVSKTLWYRSIILVKKHNDYLSTMHCIVLYTTIYTKENNSFVQFLLSQRLSRTILHFNTLLYSGILFVHLETSRSYFKSKLDVITGLYYQRPLFITIIAFFFIGCMLVQ